MYTKKVYRAIDMARWTRFESFYFFLYSAAIVSMYYFFDLNWIKIPWTPLALIGTAVAFVIGFQNNSAYGRIWEARKIWGGIVNSSRTFGMYVQDMINNEHTRDPLDEESLKKTIKQLTYRHIAWMTALRHAMRSSKPWETVMSERTNKEWSAAIQPPEWKISLEEDLRPYLSAEDMKYVLSKSNRQTAILYRQSRHLEELKRRGLIWEFSFLQIETLIQELFTLQGKSERIKNFPYPRQFATLNHYFMWIFVWLLPLAIVPQFAEIGSEMLSNHPVMGRFFVWLSIPFYVAVSWVFHTMERIGRTGENPFEGSANDVPISTIARGIEIDLRQNLGESDEEIPDQFEVIYDVQM